MCTRDVAKDKSILDRLNLDPAKQLICSQCSGTLILGVLGFLKDEPTCIDLTTTPWVKEAGIEVLDQPFVANGNIATADGCLSSQYLAAWIIAKLADRSAAESAIHYMAPVGEKESTVSHSMSVYVCSPALYLTTEG